MSAFLPYRQCEQKKAHSVHEYKHGGKEVRCPGCADGGKTMTFRGF